MIFVIYAAVVWYWAARWRRSWRAFAVVTAALLVLGAIMAGHERVGRLIGFGVVGTMVNALLYPYSVLLGLVGYYIAVLPRPPGEGAKHPCHHCGYDLVGMEEFAAPVCPECGSAAVMGKHGR